MPELKPVPAVTFATHDGKDISDRIAPPYDVLDHESKARLVAQSPNNISVIDLPHLPAKTVGPDEAYVGAGETYRRWLEQGVLIRRDQPAFFVYQQTYTVQGQMFKRRGLIGNVKVQPFGPSPDGKGGIHPHEQTFSAAKEDRLKLMRATQAQLSPIFGLYSDPDQTVGRLLDEVIGVGEPTFFGKTHDDDVLHEVWAVDDEARVAAFREALEPKDLFIADGHHRYNTALNYYNELKASGRPIGNAAYCLFVLVSMQDPGMIVLPTHRVIGNMPGFDFDRFRQVAEGRLNITPVAGTDPAELEKTLDASDHPHAFGLYVPSVADAPLYLATTVEDDPLKTTHANHSDAWRQLDVAIVQHLIVEQVCQPTFVRPGETIAWKFPHEIDQLKTLCDSGVYQLGLVLRATPLDSVRRVSEAGELMPQKSTFFFPKLATGLIVNPLD
ncbi:MAG: DUF1015 domain-containing protein [Phycisphaeraceae bacterium]